MQKQMDTTRNGRTPLKFSGWSGLTFVALGILFLWMNWGTQQLENWWAIFILLPAFGMISLAWGTYQWIGRFNFAVSANLGIGLVILAVAMIFFLELSWGIWWPLMIIVPGFALMLNHFTPSEHASPAGKAIASMSVWTGGTLVLLGIVFLADRFGMINLITITTETAWWSYFIAIPTVGAFLNTMRLYLANDRKITTGFIFLFLIGTFLLLATAVEYFRLDWNNIMPIMSIALLISGVVMLISGLRK